MSPTAPIRSPSYEVECPKGITRLCMYQKSIPEGADHKHRPFLAVWSDDAGRHKADSFFNPVLRLTERNLDDLAALYDTADLINCPRDSLIRNRRPVILIVRDGIAPNGAPFTELLGLKVSVAAVANVLSNINRIKHA